MNIALIFDYDLKGSGGYEQQISTILELQKLDKYSFIAFVFSKEYQKKLESFDIKTVLISNNILNKTIRFLIRQEFFYPILSRIKIKTIFEKKLDENKIDLVYFLFPTLFLLDILTHNYIMTVWDLCHRDAPEFPEVNHYREFEKREQLYTKSLKKAVAVLVDSTLSKCNVIKRYGVDENRIYPVSFTPSVNAKPTQLFDIKSKYKINSEYIYYPAVFWAHKNHVYIVDAIALLKKEGINLTAVFSGLNLGNLAHVLDYARVIGVSELIKHIGFAPNEEIYSLYKESLAMVMPSYFGPTNIPPLEAFDIGVPVIYSDLDGLREQVGDGALLCDLKNPQSLANHLKCLMDSEEVRKTLIHRGHKQLLELQKITITDVLKNIFDDYAIKLKCWKL